MPITKLDKQELNQCHSDWSEKYGGVKEDYFACMYLTNKFHCPVPAVAPRIAFGGNDYGLDAYHIDTATKNLYLYQFKWSENHNLFKDSLERLAADGLNRIFGNPLADPNANDFLNTLRAELRENREAIKHVLVHFVFKGDLDAAEESEGLRNRRETLEGKAHLVHSYFGDTDIDLTVEFISDRRRPPVPKPVESFKIGYAQPASVEVPGEGKLMYVGFLPLMDLVRIYRSLGLRFLDRNIRFGLSFDNAPNVKIAGPWFQWMRNLTCCWLIARQEGVIPAFVLAYADGPGLPMAEKIAGQRSAEWTAFTSQLRAGAICVTPISFQQLVAVAEQAAADVAGDVRAWQDLGRWVERKITDVCGVASGRHG